MYIFRHLLAQFWKIFDTTPWSISSRVMNYFIVRYSVRGRYEIYYESDASRIRVLSNNHLIQLSSIALTRNDETFRYVSSSFLNLCIVLIENRKGKRKYRLMNCSASIRSLAKCIARGFSIYIYIIEIRKYVWKCEKRMKKQSRVPVVSIK